MRIAIGIAALAFSLAACGGGDSGESAQATVTVTTTPTPFEESSPPETIDADPYAPNLGDRALKVGQKRVGKEVSTRLIEVKYPMAPAEYRDPAKGNVFIGFRIEQCLNEGGSSENQTTYNGEWATVTASGEEYAGSGSSWTDWPAPKFPETVFMIPGRCSKGWIASEIPKGTKFDRIVYRPDGEPVAEWLQ